MRDLAGACPTALAGAGAFVSLLRRLAGVVAADAGTERVLLRARNGCFVLLSPGVLLPCSHPRPEAVQVWHASCRAFMICQQ